MMTLDIKRRIDAARQVLVGVVPNPTSQIDQITNALIYKFMSDLDDKAINQLKGKATYFTGELERYSWKNLIDTRIGNQARMKLYSEALEKISRAGHLPEFFREIFQGAFLPYRSPDTLGLFLREINHFDYSHSEELGNAYEYLLSIMSSQGDAGQFRTPRNIIDFIVDVVNPTKDDKILDPACGTAGFLVSSYRHILEQHDGKNDPEKKEKPLTPDERKRLMNNLEGYDIDPGMARIARVNMYLHGFKNPRIHQYDALSSDERWRAKFNVILANPPFMSPRGGIQPHNKFSIKSSRSEVLFVDYIMSHLRPNGRAGIIVPEGIIFQSSIAYKELRKKLVEDGLYAVVSLPSGVFMPYSGVKTSILLFDNEIAKRRSEVLFVKVENDGYTLGAQRRPTDKNDLPLAQESLNTWRCNGLVDEQGKLAIAVPKERIAEEGEYNLTGDFYRKTVGYANAKWPMVELRSICTLEYGKPLKEADRKGGNYPVFGSNGIVGYHNEPLVKGPLIIVGRKGTAGATNWSDVDCFPIDTTFYVRLKDKERTNLKYLFFVLSKLELGKINTQAGVPGLNRNDAYRVKIPLPPIEFQEQIATEIERYQKVIEGAKLVVQNWKPYFRIDPEWPMFKLGDAIQIIKPPKKVQKSEYETVGKFPIIDQSQNDIAGWTNDREALVNVIKPLVIFGDHTCNVKLVSRAFAQGADGIKIIKPDDNLLPKFLYFALKNRPIELDGYKRHFTKLKLYKIPLPRLEVQEQVIEEIETEQKAIDESKALIGVMEKKIKAKIAEIWGE